MYKNCVKTLIGFLLILLCISCTPLPIYISNSDFNTINLKLNIESTVDPLVSEMLNEKFQNFIDVHNSKNKPFFLTNYEIQNEKTITFHIVDNKLVNKNQQVSGVIVTTLGLTLLPAVMVAAELPFIVGVYYIPHDKSIVNLHLSDDINGMNTPFLITNFSNSGFLRSYEKQIEKHSVKFDEYLSVVVTSVEKDYIKKSKKK